MNTKPQIADALALSHADLLKQYNRGMEHLDRRILSFTDAQLDTRFTAESGLGTWSIRMLLGHLADAEIAFTHRLRRAAAEDRPEFTVWDEDAFIAAGIYDAPISDVYSVIESVRRWTGHWLTTLSDSQFERIGLHPQRGEQSIHMILAYSAWHLEHHAWYLEKKLSRL